MKKEGQNHPTLLELSFGYKENSLRLKQPTQKESKSQQIQGFDQFGPRNIEGKDYFLVNGPYAYPLSPDSTIDTIVNNLWFVSGQVTDPMNPDRILNLMGYSDQYRIDYIKEEKSL